MDAIALTVMFKGVGMLIAIVAGIVTLRYGFHLYKDGAGQGQDSIAFKLGNLSVSANSVGSVVMSTAFMWGVVGINLSPNYTEGDSGVQISSSKLIQNLEIPQLVSLPIDRPEEAIGNAFELKRILAASTVASESPAWGINGQNVTYANATISLSPESFSYLKNEDGVTFVTAKIHRGKESAQVLYVPSVNKMNQIEFRPVHVVVQPQIDFYKPNE